MPYKTLMVHLAVGEDNAAVLAVTASLAERYAAGVIGVAACEPVQIGYVEGDFSGALAVAQQQIVDALLKAVDAEFRGCDALRRHVLEWRGVSTLEPVAHIVAIEARCADLIITGTSNGMPSSRHADTGELVVRAGRPVLVVPPDRSTATFNTILVAWNDTRECRRAVADALPFLIDADRVIVAGVGSDLTSIHPGVRDVEAWLCRHGVNVDVVVTRADASDTTALSAIADERRIDLIVAGAYGHNRLTEWAFGGVTRELLLNAGRCVLLSH